MQYEITNYPYSLVTIKLSPSEFISVVSGALHSFVGEFDLNTNITKPNFKDYLAILLSGKSLVTNQFIATTELSLTLAPKFSGAIFNHEVNQKLYVNPTNILAWCNEVKINMTFLSKKLSAIFTDEILFSEISGSGNVFIISNGSVVEKSLSKQTIYVDNKYLIGFEEGITCEHVPLKNIKKSFLSGEGLLLKLQGEGKVWLQTREVIDESNFLINVLDSLF